MEERAFSSRVLHGFPDKYPQITPLARMPRFRHSSTRKESRDRGRIEFCKDEFGQYDFRAAIKRWYGAFPRRSPFFGIEYNFGYKIVALTLEDGMRYLASF